jgi:hypothetical protein
VSIIVLSRLLSTPLVDISPPQTGIITATRENGTIRVSFNGPAPGAVSPTERMKISDGVRKELGKNQQYLLTLAGEIRKTRGTSVPAPSPTRASAEEELLAIGRYAFGHLMPARIQQFLEQTPSDHIRLDVDERLIDLPWEIINDGMDFLCLKYAVGRRLVSDQTFSAAPRHALSSQSLRALVVSNPTANLPAADIEGTRVARLLSEFGGLNVVHRNQGEMTKQDFLLSLGEYDIVHFAGHATHNPDTPDESALCFCDGEEVTAFEIGRFLTRRAPAIVFLNACWSAEELRIGNSYPAMMRGLGRTFLYSGVTAFIGYLIPVPDDAATDLAIDFYTSLVKGQTIGESLRRARIESRVRYGASDMTWSSAVMYGEPSARVIVPPITISLAGSVGGSGVGP